MADEGERESRGRQAYASQFRLPEDEAVAELERVVGERMAGEAITAAGGAWVDDCLSLRDRSLVVVAALIAQGGVDARLRGHVRWALDHGVTPEQLEALAALLAVYVGYPRASVAMEVIREVVAEQQSS
jgi:4-carboxymuconolactone decarboxylase